MSSLLEALMQVGNPNQQDVAALRTQPARREDLVNAMMGAGAGIVGAPSDLVYAVAGLNRMKQGQPPQMAFPPMQEQPLTSDWIGQRMGADVESGPFIAGSIGVPGLDDLAPMMAKGGKLLAAALNDPSSGSALFLGLGSAKKLKDRGGSVTTSHGEKSGDQIIADIRRAQEIEKEGGDPWAETGIFRGADGQWRFEIDDSQASPGELSWGSRRDLEMGGSTAAKLPEAINHPYLGAATDGLMDYDPQTGAIAMATLDPSRRGGGYTPRSEAYGMESIEAGAPGGRPNTSTLLHEIQHAVQERENFARGGNAQEFVKPPRAVDFDEVDWGQVAPAMKEAGISGDTMDDDPVRFLTDIYNKAREAGVDADAVKAELLRVAALKKEGAVSEYKAHKMYRALAGEVEARAVQKRQSLTPSQRKARHPMLDEDVPRAKQNVRFN